MTSHRRFSDPSQTVRGGLATPRAVAPRQRRTLATPLVRKCSRSYLIILLALIPVASAQQAPQPPANDAALPSTAASLPTASLSIDPPDDLAARSAFAYVTAAIEHAAQAIARGEDPLPQGADIPPPEGLFPGACVTLRKDGRVIGRGWFVGGVRSVEYATARAIEQALTTLPESRDLLQRKAAGDSLRSAIVSLELSGQPIPLVGLQTYSQLDDRLDMGCDGLLATLPIDQAAPPDLQRDRAHAIFPLAMLASSTSPARAGTSSVAVASGDPTLAIMGVAAHEAQAIARTHGVTLSKLRVRQLAQLIPGGAPLLLTRGARLARASDLSTPALVDLHTRLARHVIGRCTGSKQPDARVEIWQSLQAFTGVQDGFAAEHQAALTALALARASTRLPASDAQQARGLALRLASQSLAADRTSLHADPVAAALWAIVVHSLRANPDLSTQLELQPWLEPLATDILRGLESGVRRGKDTEAIEGLSKACPEGTESLLALGYACSTTLPGVRAEACHAAGRSLLVLAYQHAEPGMLVSQLPWLWDAQRLLAPESPPPPALDELRAHIWENQARFSSESPTPDLDGGLLLKGSLSPSGKPMPSWHSLRPLPFLAGMLGDERSTPPDQRMRELSRLLTSLRFLRQLMVDESFAWADAPRDPDGPSPLFGLRAAPWEASMPLDASLAGLLALTSTLEALDRLVTTQKPAQTAPDSFP